MNSTALFSQPERVGCGVVLGDHIGDLPVRHVPIDQVFEEPLRHLGEMCLVPHPVLIGDDDHPLCAGVSKFDPWIFFLKDFKFLPEH
jgi:hypothetical protein